MFCPSCRAEFREGFTECGDCGVALVDELRPEGDDTHKEIADGLTAVYVTESSEELARIVDRLEKAEVPYVIEAGTALALLDGREAELPHDWSARISVASEFVSRADRIVEQERTR